MSLERLAEWGVFEVDLRHGVLALAPEELPNYVYSAPSLSTVGQLTQPPVYAKKPVIYVYGEPDTDLSLEILSKQGTLDYFWPGATRIGEALISWDLKLQDELPETAPAIRGDLAGGPSLWFQNLRVSDASYAVGSVEAERFLFYEFRFPKLVLISRDDQRPGQLTWHGSGLLRDAFVLEGAGKRITWGALGDIEPDQCVDVESPSMHQGNPEWLAEMLRGRLMHAGLWRTEADHLLEIWSPWLWGQHSKRVVGVLERAHYDELLHLSVNPTPRECVRVGLIVCSLS